MLTRFKQRIRALRLIPSKGGCFEFVANGESLYSKLATGTFPDEDAMLAAVAERLR